MGAAERDDARRNGARVARKLSAYLTELADEVERVLDATRQHVR